jgi:ribonucleoside-diphosphate reductase alpha chain
MQPGFSKNRSFRNAPLISDTAAKENRLMKTAHLQPADRPTTAADVPMQPASWDIWDKKYRLKAKDGRPIDETIDGTYQRVARALAEVETTPELREHWYEKFLWALAPWRHSSGRIISNAGAWEHKPATSTINCTVSGTIRIRWTISCARCMKRG